MWKKYSTKLFKTIKTFFFRQKKIKFNFKNFQNQNQEHDTENKNSEYDLGGFEFVDEHNAHESDLEKMMLSAQSKYLFKILIQILFKLNSQLFF